MGLNLKQHLIGMIAGIAAVITCNVSAALAGAELVRSQGTVLVNTGEGFQKSFAPMVLKHGARAIPADGPMSLKAGDRVLVSAHSSAELRYADGCRVPLTAKQMVTISTRSPCSYKACTPTASGGCTVLATNGLTGALTGAIPGIASTILIGTVATVAADLSGKLDKKNDIKNVLISP